MSQRFLASIILSALLYSTVCLAGCRKSSQTLNAELVAAVKAWEPDDVEKALKAGADVNTLIPAVSNPGVQEPVLSFALGRGDRGCVRVLLDRGADVNARATNGMTPFVVAIAVERKLSPLVLEMLEKEPKLNFPVDSRPTQVNSDALFNAAALSNVELVNELIRRGAIINARDKDGSTALHIAARFNSALVINALIAQGADVTIKDNKGLTAADIVRPRLR
jgi:ankyrin repeat protein